MSESVRLDLPLLLPGVKDDQDACVARLVSLLEARSGIERVHVVHENGEAVVEHDVGAHPQEAPQTPAALCLHYDPGRITLGQLEDLAKQSGATIAKRYAHEIIAFRDVGSEDEGARLEQALRTIPGVTAAIVNYPAQRARIEYDVTAVSLSDIVARLTDAGASPVSEGLIPPPLEPRAAPEVQPERGWYARNKELAWSVTAGILTLGGWLAGRALPSVRALPIAVFCAAYVFGARDNVGHLVKDLSRRRFHFNIDFLMVVAAIGAAILGQWLEGALLLFLFSLGHALEHYALGRARNAIKALGALVPHHAIVRRGGADVSVPIEQVQVGDVVLVRAGERIAVDGHVQNGQSAVNQAPITGESVPVEKTTGDQVFAGSVNGEGLLLISVSAAVGDRTLDRVIKLVAEAETQKAPTQEFTDRFQRVFVPAVLIADVLLIALPPVLGFWSLSVSFYRAMALLVAASPCALALGTPATVLAGIAQAARNGVLIKGGAHLESLGSVDTIAFDKTGTITMGEPVVTDVLPADGVEERQLIALAAAVERHSQHPLAKAITVAANERSVVVPVSADVQSVTGRGIRASVDGRVVEVGRASLFGDGNALPGRIREDVARLEANGRTTMIVRSSGENEQWLGVIGVADEPRAEAKRTLAELRQLGIHRIVMLTGDNAGVASAVGRSVGVDDVRAGLMPEDKVAAIQELSAGTRVAMVGDGVNDAPALAHASVGIAMGGAGTAAALETADVALMGDKIERLPFVIGLSRQARRVIRQNLAASLSVIAILVVTTVAGIARIGPAVVVHEGSTLLVIANALRLLWFRQRSSDA